MPRISYGRTAAIPRQKSVYWLIVAIVLFVLANAAYFLFFREPGTVYESKAKLDNVEAFQSVAIGGNQSLVSTLEGRLLLMEGSEIRHETNISGTISGIAASADKSHIFAGTSDRNIYILDDSLQQIGKFGVNGRVVAVDSSPEG